MLSRFLLLLVVTACVVSAETDAGSQLHIEENLEEYVPNELLEMAGSEHAAQTNEAAEPALITMLKQKSLISVGATLPTKAAMRKEVARVMKAAGGPARLFNKMGLKSFFAAMKDNKWMQKLMKIWQQVRAFRKELRAEMRRREGVEDSQFQAIKNAMKARKAVAAGQQQAPRPTTSRAAGAEVLRKIDSRIAKMKSMKHKSLDLARR